MANNLAAEFAEWGDQIIAAEVGSMTKKVAVQVLQGVVDKSPVLTGRFKANWNVGIGSWDTSTTTSTDPEGSNTLLTGIEQIYSATPGSPVWITNNLPYAMMLEHGWSVQAPMGMIAVTMAEVIMRP